MTNVIAFSRADSVRSFRRTIPTGAKLSISIRDTSLTFSLFRPLKARTLLRKTRGAYTV